LRSGATNAQAAITKRTLNTAEPTMVPKPTSDLEMKTPRTDVASSGAEPPAAIHVAPATSSFRLIASQMRESAASKKESQTMARPRNMKSMRMICTTVDAAGLPNVDTNTPGAVSTIVNGV
jgi:hypothetical protein